MLPAVGSHCTPAGESPLDEEHLSSGTGIRNDDSSREAPGTARETLVRGAGSQRNNRPTAVATVGTLDGCSAYRCAETRNLLSLHPQRRITLRITCGPRRARALPATFRGDAGRGKSKARDRPGRQVDALVMRANPNVTPSRVIRRGSWHEAESCC